MIKGVLLDYGGVIDQYPDEMHQLIVDLKKSGIRVALLSNVSPELAQATRLSGGYAVFDFAILSGDLDVRKPDPLIYHQAIMRFGDIMPGEILFVDDNPQNLIPARALGLHTLHFSGLGSVADIRRRTLSTQNDK